MRLDHDPDQRLGSFVAWGSRLRTIESGGQGIAEQRERGLAAGGFKQAGHQTLQLIEEGKLLPTLAHLLDGLIDERPGHAQGRGQLGNAVDVLAFEKVQAPQVAHVLQGLFPLLLGDRGQGGVGPGFEGARDLGVGE